ncbi:hypothetical protein D3C71_2017540 [compost metagenome]
MEHVVLLIVKQILVQFLVMLILILWHVAIILVESPIMGHAIALIGMLKLRHQIAVIQNLMMKLKSLKNSVIVRQIH